MAKQIGDIKIVGTVADLTFYRMEGIYYARKKSSLTGKRVKSDRRFARTMESARRLGRGSQLASKVYRSLPRSAQEYALYKELKSMAVRALKEGCSADTVLALLQQRVHKLATPQPQPRPVVRKKPWVQRLGTRTFSVPKRINSPKGRRDRRRHRKDRDNKGSPEQQYGKPFHR